MKKKLLISNIIFILGSIFFLFFYSPQLAQARDRCAICSEHQCNSSLCNSCYSDWVCKESNASNPAPGANACEGGKCENICGADKYGRQDGCKVTCPAGFHEDNSGGAGQCEVYCLPCGNHATCVPDTTPPPPPPVLTCDSNCDSKNPSSCSGAKEGCTYCNPDTNTCQTPPPDTGNRCDTNCDVKNPSSCAGAKDECGVCSPAGKCVKPSTSPSPKVSISPSVSPSISPTACYVGKFCQNCGGDAGHCTDCDGGWCEGNPNGIGGTCRSCGQTPSSPPEPSKPPFSSDMCKCDGLTAGTVIPGQPLAVTAYGKVVGSDTANAEMTGMQFYFIREIESPNNVIATARVGVTRETNTSSLKRYKAVWNVVVPKDLVSGATYRIFVRQPPYCSRATAMLYTPAQKAVTVSKTTAESSFVTQIIGMMQSVLPWKITPVETGSTLIAQTPERAVLGTAEKPLQIGTFAPAAKLPSPDKCYIARFRAP